MSERRNDEELLADLSRWDPADPGEVAREFGPERRAAVLARAKEQGPAARTRAPRGVGQFRSPWVLRAASVAVGIVVVAAFALASGDSDELPGPGVEYAAAAVRTAEVNPKILVTAPGWEIEHVEPLSPDSGETQFSDGASDLAITWYPARFYNDYLEDRASVQGPEVPVEVLDLAATMIRYPGGTDFATMLPPQGDVFIEIRGNLGSEEAYRGILESLETTDVDTWLAAMPADVVRPEDQGALVDSLLEGVPLPPGFDLAKLRDEEVLNADAIRIKVADTVACGWLDSWSAGDEAARTRAVEAMSTAETWPAVEDPPPRGGHVKSILDYANQIEAGHLDGGYSMAEVTEEGDVFGYGPPYAAALACDSLERTRLDSTDDLGLRK